MMVSNRDIQTVAQMGILTVFNKVKGVLKKEKEKIKCSFTELN
jgi:hypothetical protein